MVAWYGLDKPDFKYPNNPTYGVGAILNDKAAQALNAATREIEKESGEKGQSYAAGDTVRIRMSAETRDKKTGEITKFRPHVYMPDLTPATDEEIAKLGRNSKFTLEGSGCVLCADRQSGRGPAAQDGWDQCQVRGTPHRHL